MLSNYFCTKRYFLENPEQTNPTPIGQIYGAFHNNNEVRVHGLVLLVEQSWRVASPYDEIYLHTWDNVTEADGEHGDESEVEGVEEGKILLKGTETGETKDHEG